MNNQIIRLVLVIALSGCSDPPAPSNTIPVHTGHKDVTNSLIENLKDNNVWYHAIDDTTVEVSNPPPEFLIPFLGSEVDKIIPKGRSFSVSEEIRNTVYQKLRDNNVSYHVVIYDNSDWIVWATNDTDMVNSIIDSAAAEALNAEPNQ